MNTKQARAAVEPVRQRTQYSCMAASMAMCLRALDHDVTEDEVNRVMGAKPMQGAAWEQALATAQHYGCRATLTMPSTVEQLRAWTDAGVPVMIAWNPEGRPWSHASVVFDVDADLNVYVADPNIPNPKETVRVVPEAEFYGKWYEKFPDYLVRRPACAIEREITPEGRQVNLLAGDENKPKALKLLASRTASKRAGFDLWLDRTKSPKGTPYPKSKWDTLGDHAPFRWATPAQNIDGSFPEPWRVADKDAALAFLKRMFPSYRDIYAEYESDLYRGRQRLWIGLRDNRDKQAHYTKILIMFDDLKEKGWPVMRDVRGDRSSLWLMDDLERNALRRTASSPVEAKAPKKKELTVRNPGAWALAERGGVGQGSHKNKQDYERGKARNPKHRNRRDDREASLIAKLANRAKYTQWQAQIPGSDVKDSKEQKALDAFWNWSRGELIEAVTLDDSLEMAAWDLGYQGRPLRFAPGLEFLARIRRVDLRKEYEDGKDAKAGKSAAYSGNPNGEPIYDVKVDHGEHQPLSGGHDIMKRLQDQLRIEQGNEPRDPNPRLAAAPLWQMDNMFRGTVNDDFIAAIRKHRELRQLLTPAGRGLILILSDYVNDPKYDGGSEYDVSFAPQGEGLWEIRFSASTARKLIPVLQSLLKVDITSGRQARWNANTTMEMDMISRLARRYEGGGSR